MNDINLYTGEEQFRLVIGGDYWVVSEPEGWDEYMFVTRRDKNKHGFITTMTNDDITLKFSQESGKEYIDAEFAINGVDANIVLKYGTWDGVTFEEQISIRLALDEREKYQNYSEMGGGTSESIELFRTRLDVKADVNGDKDFNNNEITPLNDKELIFHSKVLQKETTFTKSYTDTSSDFFSQNYPAINYITTLSLEKKFYGILGLDFVEPSELTDYFTGSTGITQSDPFRKSLFQYKAKERGNHDFNIDITISALIQYFYNTTEEFPDDSGFDKSDCLLKMELILRVGADEVVLYSTVSTNCEDTFLSVTDEHIVETYSKFLDQNEEVQLYVKYTFEQTLSAFINIVAINNSITTQLTVNIGSLFNIVAVTETRYTTGGVGLIYECFQKCLEIITGNKYPLVSKFLGREEIGYEVTGCAGKYALTNGKKIRALPSAESHLKFSGNEFFNSLDAMFCVGMGIELSEGKYYFTGSILSNQITTTFYIPSHESGNLIFYRKESDELIGTVTEVNILSGSGTNADPYVYVYVGSFPDIESTSMYVIVEDLVGTEVVRFEDREYFYRNIELLEIDSTLINKKSYRELTNNDIIFNEFNIGYKKFPENELNTLDEFNTKQEYLLPIKTQKRKLDKMSDFIASGYAIELQRRAQFENESNGKSAIAYDDDVFIIALTAENYEISVILITEDSIFLSQKITNPPALPFSIQVFANAGGTTVNAGTYTVTAITDFGFLPYKSILTIAETLVGEDPILTSIKYISGDYSPERAQAFSTVNNIIGPNSSYNLRLSPKRMMLNWGKWINSGLFHKADTEVIKNTFTKNNIISGGLVTQFNEGETCNLGDDTKALLYENNDETLANVYSNLKLLKPTRIKFAARLTWLQVQYIRDRLKKGYLENAYGYLTFNDLEGNTRHAFIEEMQFNPKIEEVEFTLLEKA